MTPIRGRNTWTPDTDKAREFNVFDEVFWKSPEGWIACTINLVQHFDDRPNRLTITAVLEDQASFAEGREVSATEVKPRAWGLPWGGREGSAWEVVISEPQGQGGLNGWYMECRNGAKFATFGPDAQHKCRGSWLNAQNLPAPFNDEGLRWADDNPFIFPFPDATMEDFKREVAGAEDALGMTQEERDGVDASFVDTAHEEWNSMTAFQQNEVMVGLYVAGQS
jgi:hypothetical protein|tara:strand:+ start:1131 stop:1799 length:669 start_codon:yes stop_codon:yes gene_type:complete